MLDDVVYFFVLDIGGVNIPSKTVLAPMAGVADRIFRLLSRSEGAGIVFTELISADGLVRGSGKSHRLMAFASEERPIGIQLFGSDPGIMADAAVRAEMLKPEFIDLNFGCPVKKVVKRGAGAAVLKDLSRLREITRCVVSAISTPVTVKIRSGWHDTQIVAVKASRILEEEGVCAVTVHARTQNMGFSGRSDWTVIREVKDVVSIPVIGNGDVMSPEDARQMCDQTGCDLVMIGRGALGRPWTFRQVNHYLETGALLNDPTYRERIAFCLRHFRMALSDNNEENEEKIVREMRKHIGWYIKGLPGCTDVRRQVFSLTKPEEVVSCLEEYANQLKS